MRTEQAPVFEPSQISLANRLQYLTQEASVRLGRIAAATVLMLGSSTVALTTYEASTQEPAVAATGGYPWADSEHVPQPPASDSYTWGYESKEKCDGESTDYNCGSYKEGPYYVYDHWNYYLRNCTSYVAWRLSEEFDVHPSGMGHGADWDDNARTKNWAVDDTPEIGDIAQWDSGGGGFGHVAFVEEVGTGDRAGKVRVAEYNYAGTGLFTNSRWTTAEAYIDVNGMNPPGFSLDSGTGTDRPAESTNLPWIFENMEGDTGSMSTFNANTGKTPAAAVFNNHLYVLSYEQTGGNLRLAKATPGWRYSTLDGVPGAGRKDGNVGQTPSLVVHGSTLHAFYYDAGGGNLRHAFTADGANWRYEDLDGTPGSILRHNGNMGQTPAAVSHSDGGLHVLYRDASAGNLRHAWAPAGQPWRSEVLEGDPHAISRKDGDIGHNPTILSYNGALHAFYHNKTAGTLRHAWKAENGSWRFEDLDGTPHAICGLDSKVGEHSAAVIHNNTLQVFYSDVDNKNLRHAWADQSGWRCETLEGDDNAVLGNGGSGEVGAMPTAVSLGPTSLHVFAKETKWGSLRHYWTTASGWRSENFDGFGGNPSGRVSHSTGDDPLTVRLGSTPQLFYYDNTRGDLRHAIPQ